MSASPVHAWMVATVWTKSMALHVSAHLALKDRTVAMVNLDRQLNSPFLFSLLLCTSLIQMSRSVTATHVSMEVTALKKLVCSHACVKVNGKDKSAVQVSSHTLWLKSIWYKYLTNMWFVHIELTACDPDPCNGNGNCSDAGDTFSCSCRDGWTSDLCEQGGGTFVVIVEDGFAGWSVSDINECDQSVCKNGGKCINFLGGYQCECASGYNGTNCESGKNQYIPWYVNYGVEQVFLFSVTEARQSISETQVECQCVPGHGLCNVLGECNCLPQFQGMVL